MASRVNLKFVFILGGAMALLATIVVWVGLKNYMPGGEQNIERGQKEEAAGNLPKAIMYYGRAVNKDRGNVEWVHTWLKAIEKYTPPDRQSYGDMYRGDYLSAIRALADADRTSTPAFKRYLEERYQIWLHQGSSLQIWETFAREYDDIMKLYQGDDAGRKSLERYHGLALAGQYAHNTEIDPKKALDELAAAVKVDPKDRDAALAISGILRTQAQKAIRANHPADAEKILAESRKKLEDFVKGAPEITRARFALLETDIAAGARSDGKETVPELLRRNKDAIGVVLDAMNAVPPEQTDYITALALAPWVGVAFDDGAKRADDMLDRVRKGHDKDANFYLHWAQLEMSRNQIDKAIALEQQVLTFPDLPVSLEGLLLHDLRIRAVEMQADAWFIRTQIETDPAKRTEAIAKLKDLRKDLASRVGDSDDKVLAIDGRLDFLAGDFLGARTRISRYNDQTQQSNPDMVMLEAQLLNQLGQRGAAKTKYERVLTLQGQNVRALAALGLIEASERDYKNAANHFATASAFFPSDKNLQELAKNAKMLASGEKTDEVLNALTAAQDAGLTVTGDIQRSIAIIREALVTHPDELRLTMALVTYLVAAKDIDGAKAVLQDAIKKNPDNAALKKNLARIERDPLELFLEQVNESKGTDLQKHLWRFTAFIQSAKIDEARKELEEAVKIDPNDVGVINAQFDNALITQSQAAQDMKSEKKTPAERAKAEADQKNAFAEQDRLVAKARQMNLDKVGGDLFYARSLMNRGKTPEAVGVLTDIKGKDKLNLMAWRLLGLALFDQRRYVEAADALKTAVSIKPDDILSINAAIHALIGAQQEGEALQMARKSENVAVADPDFFETYLTLEAEIPGGDKNKAIEARKRYSERRPENRGNRTRLASLLINANRTDEADKLIADLLKEKPDDSIAVELKAALMGRKGDVGGAVKKLLDFIATRKPEARTVELYINTARLMLQLGEPDQAIKLLTDNRSAQDPKDAKDKKTALIDRELGDIKYNLASTATTDAKYKELMDGALASYQAVLDSGAEDVQYNVRKRIVEVCMKSRNYDGMAKAIAQLPPAVQNDSTILLLQAEAAMNQDQREKALRLYDQAVASDNKNSIAYLKRGDFKSMEARTLKDALADYEQMKRVDPNSVIARVRMARVLRMVGRDDDAVKAVKDAISIEPYNESLRLAVALMLREIGKHNEAAQAMEDAVNQFQGAKQWRLGAAQYWARVNRWDKAVDHMREVWKDDKSIPVAIAFTEYLLNNGDATNAYNVLQTSAISSKVNETLALRLLRARVYNKTGRTTDAAQEITDSLVLVKPESLEDASLFMSGVGGMYPDPEAQINVLDRLEKDRPFTGYLAIRAAETRIRVKSTRLAALATLQAIAFDPRVADAKVADRIRARAWSLLGTDSYNEQNWQEAHDRFEKGQKLDPGNAELNNNLAYILATKLNKCAEALPFAITACQMVTNKSDFLDTKGAAEVCAHKCDDAVKTLTSGLQAALNDGDRVPIYIHMGKARVCQGDKVEARRVASVARDLMSNLPEVRKQYQTDWDELDRSINAN